MYKINLNLLPPAKKKRLDSLVKFVYSKNILEIVILICSLTATVLLWNWIVLEENFYNLVNNSILINQEKLYYNQEIKKINSITREIVKAGKAYAPLAGKTLEVIRAVPNDVKINYLHLDRKTQIINISGAAKTRNDLLNLQTALRSISWLEKVETPVSKLFQPKDINFEFSTKIKGIRPLSE